MASRLVRFRRIPHLLIESSRVPVFLDPKADVNHGEYVTLPAKRIIVAPQEDQTLYSTLVHEALHRIVDCHGIDLSERTIRCLEVGMVSLIARNPKLVRGIQKHHG